MDKTIKILNSGDEELLDLAFWKSKSAEEKLSVVQILREQYIYLFNQEVQYFESLKKIRKVYRIFNKDIS